MIVPVSAGLNRPRGGEPSDQLKVAKKQPNEEVSDATAAATPSANSAKANAHQRRNSVEIARDAIKEVLLSTGAQTRCVSFQPYLNIVSSFHTHLPICLYASRSQRLAEMNFLGRRSRKNSENDQGPINIKPIEAPAVKKTTFNVINQRLA